MIKKATIAVIGFVLLLSAAIALAWVFATHETPSLAEPETTPDAPASSRGAAAFEGAGFGGISMAALDSHALPWRLASAALVLQEQSRNPDLPANLDTLHQVLARYGFLVNGEPVNRPERVEAPDHDMPPGFTYGDLAPLWGTKIRAVNLGCAACHAGTTYDATGAPTPDAIWLGMPNTSLNLEAYTRGVFEALRHGMNDPEALVGTVNRLYPDSGWPERLTTRFMVLPLVKRRLAELAASDRPLPFPNGVPGSTNGVAALKFAIGVPLLAGPAGDNGIVSVPDLGYRHWRTRLLADGAYAPPGPEPANPTQLADLTVDHLDALARITTFFTVPSMGVHPDEAISHLEEAGAIFAFLSNAYRPMAFPGAIDRRAAEEGGKVFDRECAACHGSYEWRDGRPVLASYPNWRGDVGTDRMRADTFTPGLADMIGETVYAAEIAVRPSGVYAAPPLTGLWASAPFLHNGSVPTLHHLLNPASRPKEFLVGGHALDFETVGLRLKPDGAFPDGYVPFSEPVLFDTSKPGQTNGGHHHGAALPQADKRSLLEYLKLL